MIKTSADLGRDRKLASVQAQRAESHGRGVNGFWGVAVRGDAVKKTVSRSKVVLGGVGLMGGKLTDSGEDREI